MKRESFLDEPLGVADTAVLVTGATRGIGRAVAERLAVAGAHVVVTSRSRQDAEAEAKRLNRLHGRPALGVACDVGDAAAVERLFERIDAWTQVPLAGLVNNAGYPFRVEHWERALTDFAPEEIVKVFADVAAVDVTGARLCTYHALSRMMPHGGSVVYVSSTPALTGFKGTPYTEAKAAVLGLMRDVARTYGAHGIRANAVALGNIKTDSYRDYAPDVQAALAAEASLGRWGEPEEVADAVLFFLSEMSRFVTGQTLVVDGGTVMR